MAILSSLPGVSVTIHTEKGQLTEYPDDEPEHVEGLKVSQDRVVSSYVEGESGALFWFQLQVDKSCDKYSSHPLFFLFEVNGERLRTGGHCYPQKIPGQLWMTEKRGIPLNTDAGPMLKRFKFITLESVPHEGHISNPTENEEKRLNKMGMVEVRVCEVKEQLAQKKTSNKNGTRKRETKEELAMKASQAEDQKNSEVQNSSLKRADEKTIQGKAISLGIEYSDEPQKEAKRESLSRFEYVQSYNHPLAVFRFKYRCKADLEKLMIIRKEAIPEPEMQPASVSIIKNQESDEGSPELGFQATLEPPASIPAPLSSSCPKPSPAQDFTPSLSSPSPPQSELAALLSSLAQTGTRANVDDYEARIRALLAPSQAFTAQVEPRAKQFEELTEDELRELAKDKHKTFESLENEEIRRIARQHYKDFVDLTEDEVKALARDRYAEKRGIQTVKDEVKAEKIIKEEQTTVKRENRFSQTPLAHGPQIGEKRTIDLTLDDEEDYVVVPGQRKKRN